MTFIIATAVAFAVMIGALLQRVSGAGLALVSAPLLTLLLGPTTGVLVVNVCSVCGAALIFTRVRRDVEWLRYRALALASIVGVVPGSLLVADCPGGLACADRRTQRAGCPDCHLDYPCRGQQGAPPGTRACRRLPLGIDEHHRRGRRAAGDHLRDLLAVAAAVLRRHPATVLFHRRGPVVEHQGQRGRGRAAWTGGWAFAPRSACWSGSRLEVCWPAGSIPRTPALSRSHWPTSGRQPP